MLNICKYTQIYLLLFSHVCSMVLMNDDQNQAQAREKGKKKKKKRGIWSGEST
jgi:hypothetical protein